MASAMTPDPTVAMVDLVGDIGRVYGRLGRSGRGQPGPADGQLATPALRSEDRPVVVTSAVSKPASSSAASSPAGS
jgi:hypothetical protein